MVDGDRSETALDEAQRAVEQLRSDHGTGESIDGRSPECFNQELSDAEKIALHQQFKQGVISRAAATVLFGPSLQAIDDEAEAFGGAMKLDRSGVFQE